MAAVLAFRPPGDCAAGPPPDPAALARLQATAFTSGGRLNDFFAMSLLRRADETRNAVELRRFHPDALPVHFIARVLAALLEKVVGRELTDAERGAFIIESWSTAETIAQRPDRATALLDGIAHAILSLKDSLQ